MAPGAFFDALHTIALLTVQLLLTAICLVLSPILIAVERLKAGRRKAFKSILITGGNSGLGEAMALQFAKEGVRLVLTARNESRLEQVAAECSKRGAVVEVVAVDVVDQEKMEEVILSADKKQPLDLVIANAGVASPSGTQTQVEYNTRPTMDINVGGVWNTLFPIISRMRARKHGQVCIMSSLAGFSALPGATEYATSKFAVRVFGECVRPLLRADNVGMTVICPGYVRSRLTCGPEMKKPKFSMPFFMEADEAARIMIDGLERNVGEIIYPVPTSILSQALNTLPYVIRELIAGTMVNKKLVKRMLKTEEET